MFWTLRKVLINLAEHRSIRMTEQGRNSHWINATREHSGSKRMPEDVQAESPVKSFLQAFELTIDGPGFPRSAGTIAEQRTFGYSLQRFASQPECLGVEVDDSVSVFDFGLV